MIYPHDVNWARWMHSTVALIHDQEPLNFEFYDSTLLKNQIQSWQKQHQPFQSNFTLNPFWLQHICERNLSFISTSLTLNDRMFLIHSEQNSLDVQKYSALGVITIYYWAHAIIARDWYRYAQIDPDLNFVTSYQYAANVYCRAWSGSREYRLYLLSELAKTTCKVKICFNEIDNNIHYLDHKFNNRNFSCEVISNTQPNQHTSNASAEYSAADYKQCWFDLVLETVFDDSKHHLTEKIFRPIACGKPFVLASTAGSLAYLRSYGFRTFSPFIDESYDLETDAVRRTKKIVKTITEIQNIIDSDHSEIRKEIDAICHHNKQHFFSDDFMNYVLAELKENIGKARKEIRFDGNHWRWLRIVINQDPILKHLLFEDQIKSRLDIASVLLELKGFVNHRPN